MRYDVPDEKGKTRRERNIDFGKAELNPDYELPEEGVHLWYFFWDLDQGRSPSFSGASPLKFSDYFDWQKITGNILSREEISILRTLDRAYVKHYCEEAAADATRKSENLKAK